MARTYQRRSGRARKAGSSKTAAPRRPVRIPVSSKKRRSPYSKKGGSRLLRWVGIFFLFCVVAGVAFAAGGYLGLVRAADQLEEPSSRETHPTYIYSSPVGENEDSLRVIGTIFQGKNTKTALESDMPPHLLNALVAKEDERFMQHAGVDLWGIARALYVDIQAGKKVEGASTITQQYVKNAYLNNDRTWKRKIREALIAVEVERRMDKPEILSSYLNTMYYGSNAYGIEAAAETYFNKATEDLTVAESASLVGILWSPSTLGSDPAAARDQRDLVLEKMFDAGYINRQDYEAALAEKLPGAWPQAPMMETGLVGPQLTRNFADFVQEELVEMYGAATVAKGGLEVYTTMDLEAQQSAYDTLYGPSGGLPYPESPDAALVSVEPDTGAITAMVGNRDQGSHFNLVTQAQRQPGSSFKPFALIAALEQGIDPKTTEFVSEKKVYEVPNGAGGTEEWKVKNFGKVERGPINLEEALWESDNSVFTDLVMNVDDKGLANGADAVVDVAKRLGISAEFPDPAHPSVVLGTKEVSPLDLTTAYATIANRGRRVEPTAIRKVVETSGDDERKVLYQAKADEGQQVIDPEIAAQATEIMIGDVTQGIADDAALDDRPVAGKTGTSENYFDSWFLGFTPQLTTGMWVGYAEGGKTLEKDLDYALEEEGFYYLEGISPEKMWQAYMEEEMSGKPVKRFANVDDDVQNGAITADEEVTDPALAEDPTLVDPALADPALADPALADPAAVAAETAP